MIYVLGIFLYLLIGAVAAVAFKILDIGMEDAIFTNERVPSYGAIWGTMAWPIGLMGIVAVLFYRLLLFRVEKLI